MPPTAAVAPTKELSRRTPNEAPMEEAAPGLSGAGAEEGDQPAPPVNAREEGPAAAESIVVELDPEAGIPATTEPTEVGQAGNEDGPPAPPEPEMEGAPLMVREGEAVTVVGDAEMETIGEDEAEPENSTPPTRHSSIRRVVEKVPGQPLRLAPRLSSMEDVG